MFRIHGSTIGNKLLPYMLPHAIIYITHSIIIDDARNVYVIAQYSGRDDLIMIMINDIPINIDDK